MPEYFDVKIPRSDRINPETMKRFRDETGLTNGELITECLEKCFESFLDAAAQMNKASEELKRNAS